MKLRLLAASLAALGLGAGVAVAQTAPAPQQQAPAPAPLDKAVLSYAIGYDQGSGLSQLGADVDINAVIRALQDGYAKKAPAYPAQQMEAQIAGLQQRMTAKVRAEIETAARENRAKSEAFLAANRTKSGVITLPTGVQYRIIETGTGAKPTLESTVQVHYRGSVSTGKEFFSTYAQENPEPSTFKLGDFPIEGARDVMLMMPVGSRWEVFVPPSKAFGDNPRPVGPGQALVLDIKLVSAK
ncbi:MAG TPA: FKBP-type peptidyl-prolyl cis-trans isomerase N-terminal domain-containing protein [Arenimonas sp.]|uniref:FKBP-type peptidyl-prolyl cis-trans isomerase N-terminal domain-containing protein n=1 Tax=Arenimonas sp. TaxID=1872635 RepID=UPI002D7FEC82|nr:FKBP-type peptidyl-prolyl cis-trans isomerase N-terminal domain-containing protein [Arenimonas sp.]HEU0153330.1 FKBP-type peptidyl-prolyl cis-trans isomerase N-terminal domain-containing protein [Arenimonas sp.]